MNDSVIWGYYQGRRGSGSCSSNKGLMCMEEIPIIVVLLSQGRVYIEGKVNSACVSSVMVYGSETWVMKVLT